MKSLLLIPFLISSAQAFSISKVECTVHCLDSNQTELFNFKLSGINESDVNTKADRGCNKRTAQAHGVDYNSNYRVDGCVEIPAIPKDRMPRPNEEKAPAESNTPSELD